VSEQILNGTSAQVGYTLTLYTRPCNVYWHVTAPYKLSFIIIIITLQRYSRQYTLENTDRIQIKNSHY